MIVCVHTAGKPSSPFPQIFGVGASRTVTPKSNSLYTSLFRVAGGSGHSSPSTGFPKSPIRLPHLTDEITAILMTTHSQKMSLIELTKGYNQAFCSQGPKIDSSDLIQAIRKLSNFKVQEQEIYKKNCFKFNISTF